MPTFDDRPLPWEAARTDGDDRPAGPEEDAELVQHRSVGRAKAEVVVDQRLRQTTVRWRESGTGYVLRRVAACQGDPAPRPELLVRVASSVR